MFCHRPLGANQVIEHFPVGRRLAFDAERGRLWVVCRKCERWNLTPLEERWEAVETCERLFRRPEKYGRYDKEHLRTDPETDPMLLALYSAKTHKHCRYQKLYYGADRDRTGDLLLAKQALSRLSYGPKTAPEHRRKTRDRLP